MSLEEVKTQYFQYMQQRNLSPQTIDKEAKYTNWFVSHLETLGITNPRKIDQTAVDSFIKNRAYYINRKNQPNKPKTREAELSALRNFLKYLESKRIVKLTVPSLRLPNLELPKTILTKPELLKLFAQPDMGTVFGYRDRLILELLYATGIRNAELTNLQTNHIDFEARTVFVDQGKGGKDRVVPCNETALKFAKNYIFEIRPQLANKLHPNHHLILSRNGRRLTCSNLGDVIHKHLKAAKLKGIITVHTFRHTAATHLLQNGMPLRHVQELLGHQKMNTTGRYVHLNIKDLQKEYNKFHPQALG